MPPLRLLPYAPRGIPWKHSRRTLATLLERDRYWRDTPWDDVSVEEFDSYQWQLQHTIVNKNKLHQFLSNALPKELGPSKDPLLRHIENKDAFIRDTMAAIELAPMSVRITPHLLSLVDWKNPLDDPIRKQFIPLVSAMIPDNMHAKLDSLGEVHDSPVPGLVHRYPSKALFLATSVCPVYCRFCTRSYAVGEGTNSVNKMPQKPSLRRWERVFDYIENHGELKDIVVSGGDAYSLTPSDLLLIGHRLLGMPHIEQLRFASKGLAVAPSRIKEHDPWTEALIMLSNHGRNIGKQVCLHTHINHAREITWVTKNAANYLFKHGVIVRNQSVLLNGVNNHVDTMSELIKGLTSINIEPYYVYQCDTVQGIEDFRTPLQETLDLDKQIRGTVPGFMMPSFVVDLPGGGGKRLVSTFESYKDGVATYRAPGLNGDRGKREYTYYDPQPIPEEAWNTLQLRKAEAYSKVDGLKQAARAKTPHAVPSKLPEPTPLSALTGNVGLNSEGQKLKPHEILSGRQTWENEAATGL